MSSPIVGLLVSAVCACASSPVHPVHPASDPRSTVVLRDFQPAPDDLRRPLLMAAGPRDAPIEPGKVRIPIPVDGVLYEVIVVAPTLPMMIPAGVGHPE